MIVKNLYTGIKLLEFKSTICHLLAIEIWVKIFNPFNQQFTRP